MQRQPRYSKEEHARRGEEIYEQLRAQLEPDNRGRIVAIDVDTGEYVVADDVLSASEQLLAQLPDAQILVRPDRSSRSAPIWSSLIERTDMISGTGAATNDFANLATCIKAVILPNQGLPF